VAAKSKRRIDYYAARRHLKVFKTLFQKNRNM
jgi:hypothetical protein